MEEQIDKKYNLEELERKVYNLTKLIDINTIINSTLDIRKLLTIIMEIIKDIMETETSTLLLYDNITKELVFKVALGEAGDELTEKYRVKIGQGIAGWVAETREPLITNEPYSDRRFDSNFDKSTGFKTDAIICIPLLYKGKLLGVIQAINPINRPKFVEDDLKLFNIFASQAALAVQNAIYFQNALEEERINSELTSARALQESLIPDISKSIGNITIAAKTISAREIGGEFHRVYNIDENNIAISIGDIHEKGIPGGLNASIITGALHSFSSIRGKNPIAMMKHLKKIVAEDIKSIDKLSLFYGVIDVDKNEIQFVNAGIAYPILVRNGVARYIRIGNRNINDESSSSTKVIVKLKPGDHFIILTDGILNVKNRRGHVIGLKKIMNFFDGDPGEPDSIIDSILNFADEFSGGLGKREDISLIAVKVN